MAKEVDVEEVNMDMTPMIDVVFLLIIFFILMPPKEMEGQLQSYLPSDGGPPKDQQEQEEPPPKFNITITSEPSGDKEVVSSITFNQRFVCQITSLSIDELDRIYQLPDSQKNSILKKEGERDKKSLDPIGSQDMRLLISRMEDAALGAPDGKETDVMIDASSSVPFKIILAVLNAGAGAEFANMKFMSPTAEIWKP
jgi:biopolymer transport protein ExbD